MRDLTKVHREVLKAHNRVDKAIDKANEAEEELSEKYRALQSLLEKGATEQDVVPEASTDAQAVDAEDDVGKSLSETLQEEAS